MTGASGELSVMRLWSFVAVVWVGLEEAGSEVPQVNSDRDVKAS